MPDICTDNRFELIEKYKQELIECTNIETAPDEMAVLDDILFRFWQMGWLESIDRMTLVKESAKTLIHSVGNSVSAKTLRNAGRFMQNAIDGEAPEFELVQASSEDNSDTISRQDAYDVLTDYYHHRTEIQHKGLKEALSRVPSAEPEPHYCRECKWSRCHINVDKHGKSETYWRCLNWDGGTDEEGYCYEWEKRTDE